MPYLFQSLNQGLSAFTSSCFWFAASRSASFSGLVSGSSKIRSSHSIS